jgi:D-3-phosphoglycerate dehydrogenase
LANRIGKLQGQTAEGKIIRVEVELLGEELEPLMHIVMANLLAGIYSLTKKSKYNWVSAPMLSHEQGLVTAQVNKLLDLPKYPNLLICKVECEDGYSSTVAGVTRSNGEASVVHYAGYSVNAVPSGNALLLENDDVPGVIGMVGTRLGEAKINISNWVYGREIIGGRAVSFINIDSVVPKKLLDNLENESKIHRAKLVKFD